MESKQQRQSQWTLPLLSDGFLMGDLKVLHNIAEKILLLYF